MDEWAAWLGASHLGPGQIALRLGAAIAFSCLIGLDRELKHKPLGLRTNMLVALGAASFCVIVIELLHLPDPGPNAAKVDAGRVLEGIIGATTGAGIWAVGGIGVACGFGLYLHAAAITLLALFVLTILGLFERRKGD